MGEGVAHPEEAGDHDALREHPWNQERHVAGLGEIDDFERPASHRQQLRQLCADPADWKRARGVAVVPVDDRATVDSDHVPVAREAGVREVRAHKAGAARH